MLLFPAHKGTFDNVEEAEEADDSVAGNATSTFLNNVLKVNGIDVPQGRTTKPAHEKPKVAGSIAAVGAQLLPHFQNRVNGTQKTLSHFFDWNKARLECLVQILQALFAVRTVRELL